MIIPWPCCGGVKNLQIKIKRHPWNYTVVSKFIITVYKPYGLEICKIPKMYIRQVTYEVGDLVKTGIKSSTLKTVVNFQNFAQMFL